MKGHQKHTSLNKSINGKFGRNELSILGTPCGNIKSLAYKIVEALSQDYKVSYVDADHKGAEHDVINKNSALTYGAFMEYTDKINFKRFDYKSQINDYQIPNFFVDDDFILVNGNHFEAQNQLAVIDPAKPLQKKLFKLNKVKAIILKDTEEIPDYIQDHIHDYNLIPIFKWDETEAIISFVKETIKNNVPEIKGLVLAGGKSSRMKRDKSLLNYHGKTQIEYTHDLLKPLCNEVFVSCPAEQKDKVPQGMEVIEDSFVELGPFGAILSVFKKFPNNAWFVVACDLPLLDVETLQFLLNNRKTSSTATAFLDSNNEFPEPLITIWEPKSYFKLLYFLGLGYSCPRKVLINTDCHLIEAPDVQTLKNVNLPEEYEAVKNELMKK